MEKNNKILITVAIALALGILWSFHLYYELDKSVKIVNEDYGKRIYNIEEFLKAAIKATQEQQQSINK